MYNVAIELNHSILLFLSQIACLLFFLYFLYFLCLGFRHDKPTVVARLVLAESEDVAVLVEVRRSGGATAWPGAVRVTRLPASLLGAGCSCGLAPGHCSCPLPFLQVHVNTTSFSFLTVTKFRLILSKCTYTIILTLSEVTI